MKKLFNEANQSLAKTLANTKLSTYITNSLIPKEILSQFEKITKIDNLLNKNTKNLFTQPWLKQIEKLNGQIFNQFKTSDSLIQSLKSTTNLHIPTSTLSAIESIQKTNFDHIRKSTTNLHIPTSTLSAIESIQKTNFDHIRKANSALRIIKNITTFPSLSAINPIFNIGLKWEDVFDVISKSSDFKNEREYEKFEYNWAGYLPIPEIKKLFDIWKKGDKAKVKNFFYKSFSDKKEVSNLIENFNKNELFKPRIHILKKALKAHLNAEYELSIPIMLSQIDGIFIEKHKTLEDSITFKNNCENCGETSKKNIPLNANNISKHILKKKNEYLPFFLEHIIHTFSNFRNDILHGKKLDYADKDLSTKLIVTLLELNINK